MLHTLELIGIILGCMIGLWWIFIFVAVAIAGLIALCDSVASSRRRSRSRTRQSRPVRPPR